MLSLKQLYELSNAYSEAADKASPNKEPKYRILSIDFEIEAELLEDRLLERYGVVGVWFGAVAP